MKYPITAQRLREALNNKHIKAQELADRTGINKASISQYINGSHSPSNLSAGKMAVVLNVSPLWLMGFDIPKEIPEIAFANIQDYENIKIEIKDNIEATQRALELYNKYLHSDPNVKAAIDSLLKTNEGNASDSNSNP